MDKDILDQAKEDFKRCHDAEADQRKRSEDDLKFGILGEQWPEEVKSDREKEGRPCLTINRMPAFLKQVTNDARMNRPAIHVKPIGDGASPLTARIQNDLIRNIWTISQGDVCSDTALDFAASMGFGYMKVGVDYTFDDSFDQDIVLERVSNPFSIYGDPDSTMPTSADWNIAFETDWYSKAKFEAKGWKWKDIKPSSFESDGQNDLWYQDDRVRVAARWTRTEVQTELVKLSDGKIMQADEVEKMQDVLAVQGITVVGTRETKTHKVKRHIITGQEVLETEDWLGKYIPIVPMYGEEWNIAGRRYFFGLFSRAKDPQRMFNYWRTASTELVALAPKAPFVGAVGAFNTDAAKWGTANVKSHPYIEYDSVPNEPPPQRQAFAGVPAGALQEAMNASDDMKSIMGLFDASLGAKSNETSGKAIMARQREGDTSTFNFIDNRNTAVEHVGRIIVNLIPQVYTKERILRCVREDGTVYNAPINQPSALKSQLEAVKTGAPPPPENAEGEKEYVPLTPDVAQTIPPHLLEPITRIFDLTSGKYDVTVSAGPSFTTRREETAEQMMEFIRLYPQAAPVIGDLLAKNLDWPGAEQISERLKAMLPPQAAGQVPPMVKQMQEVIQKGGQELQRLQKMLDDRNAENQIKRMEADTKRLDTLIGAAEKGIEVTPGANGGFMVRPLLPPQQMNPQTPPDGGAPAFGGE
jgi:hypothetical protein